MEINEDILKFAKSMNKELLNNQHKGDYRDFTNTNDIQFELQYHMKKLFIAIEDEDKEKIEEYIADCGNILMFLGRSFNFY